MGSAATEEKSGPVITKQIDCFGCKLTSFIGLSGSGIYLGYHTQKYQQPMPRVALTFASIALCYLGVARLLSLSPFGPRQVPEATFAR